jgi:hypothetical protein
MAEPGCLHDAHFQHLQVSGFTQLGVVNMKKKVDNTLLDNNTADANTVQLTKDMSGTIFKSPRIATGNLDFTAGNNINATVAFVLPTVDASSQGETYTFVIDTENRTGTGAGDRSANDFSFQIPATAGVFHDVINRVLASTDAAVVAATAPVVTRSVEGALLTITVPDSVIGTVLTLTCVGFGAADLGSTQTAGEVRSLWLLEGTHVRSNGGGVISYA